MTGCTASRYGDHDYSRPPHNTPDDPRDEEYASPCQAMSADMPPWCQHERAYEVVVYQIGSHEWIRLYACAPCTATLRRRHRTLGPGGINGIHRITLAEPAKL